jgi:hypothetical protein
MRLDAKLDFSGSMKCREQLSEALIGFFGDCDWQESKYPPRNKNKNPLNFMVQISAENQSFAGKSDAICQIFDD